MENNSSQGPRQEEVTIKFGKGLVRQHFKSKAGTDMVQVKIPNRDVNDKTPWESFAVPASFVHNNKFSNGLWMKLPADGTTKVSRSVPHGKDDMGRTIWQNESRTVSNTELKAMVEAYKERPRDSILGDVAERKNESRSTASHLASKPSRHDAR